jgi:cytochrome c oxidase subunit 2
VSADVVHTFYVPAFNFGRQALPGVTNHFDFTPVKTGVFAGHCATYCGLYHSEMLFSVAVVSPNAFGSWLKAQSSSGASA